MSSVAKNGTGVTSQLTVRASGGAQVALQDKYVLEDGYVFLSGVQALVRTLLEQHRADARRGLRTATFVSGYAGSPLGGLDQELARERAILRAHDVVHMPGVNEELGATAAWGGQLAPGFEGFRYDGVVSAWYGKAPGLDTASDALRHGNWVGVGRRSAAVAMVGDDPSSKSSTIPSASEMALADFGMPTFYPGNVQDVLDLGLHALACSRASGLWAGLKIVTNVADATAVAQVGVDRIRPMIRPAADGGHVPHGHLLAPHTLELERSLLTSRLEAARTYAVDNGLYERVIDCREPWLGVIAAGKPYWDLREALVQLGMSDDDLVRMGVRVLKPAMIFPLAAGPLRDFASGLREILVLEEKRPFLEGQIKEALYGAPNAPLVVGKRDEHGGELVPPAGELEPHIVAKVLVGRLASRVELPGAMEERVNTLTSLAERRAPVVAARTPFFCSGCPHNRSTDAPAGALIGAGTGCHSMVMLNGAGKGEVETITQMGGEGTQWAGVAPFTGVEHFVQNMGDGTFHHSGSLSVRQAVASELHITFKLYYNQASAMTGGQAIPGAMSVPALTHVLQQEGVAKTVVTTDEVGKYRRMKLAGNAEVRERAEIVQVQRELTAVKGVTVLLHDQQCAAEKRRLRKRGKLDEPERRVVINERVCEGCGDCGQVSDCLSVRPVETRFGRKTQIHQASCNKDYSCLEGDCPSFITVTRTRKRASSAPPTIDLPEPPEPQGGSVRIRMAGVGGTGVTTVGQVLGMAAMLDGRHSVGLNQTGLAQKGGPVVSDILIVDAARDAAAKAPVGGVDVYLALDLLAALQARNLVGCDGERTVAVVSTSEIPTGEMVVDVQQAFPQKDQLLAELGRFTRRDAMIAVEAEQLAMALFDDDIPANVIMLGAACQAGLVPIRMNALEDAFRLNGAGVDTNLSALAWGRAAVAAPELVGEVLGRVAVDDSPEIPQWCGPLLDGIDENVALQREAGTRLADLDAYHSRAYAATYAAAVAEVYRRASASGDDEAEEIAVAFARNLYKLMAYKDEYEVARLHLLESENAKLRDAFGTQAKVHWHLHPPLLRALGLRRKVVLGEWFRPAFVMLRAARRLRGTPLDPFGRTRVRRVERRLVGDYRQWVDEALAALTSDTHAIVREICELPDVVRGYEEIKLSNVERCEQRATTLLGRLHGDRPTVGASQDALGGS